MKPYAITSGDFDRRALDLLTDAITIVDLLPDDDGRGRPLRCHEVARVVGKLLGLRVVDCMVGAIEHTVCYVGDKAVLDPYCPARVPQVQLVYLWPGAPPLNTYRSVPNRTDIDEKLVTRLVRHVDREWSGRRR